VDIHQLDGISCKPAGATIFLSRLIFYLEDGGDISSEMSDHVLHGV
jgi:hypothetical protein